MICDAKKLAQSVIDAWNSHDLEKILSHYSDDFELTSPLIKKNMGIENGTIKGKDAVRAWWKICLDKVPDLTFELIDIAEGVDSLAVIQKSSHNNKNIVSNFYFDTNGKIYKENYYN